MAMLTMNKRKLQIAGLVLACLCVGLLIGARTGSFLRNLSGHWAVGFLILPFLLLAIIHLLLMYDSWFGPGRKEKAGVLKLSFFSLISIGYAAILVCFAFFFLIPK
jgi:hypothetical protein